MCQYTLISSLPTNHFISSDQFSGHFSDEWLDWNNPKFKHFEWGRFCSKGYQSPNILEHFISSLYLDVELQSKIRKILFSTVFAFLLMLLGQKFNSHSVVFSEKSWCTVASQSKLFEGVWGHDTTVIPSLILGVNRRNET